MSLSPDTVGRWKAGWWTGAGVVALAAGLLLGLIGLARRITRQADEITEALTATRDNTAPLFELLDTNRTVERILAPLRTRR